MAWTLAKSIKRLAHEPDEPWFAIYQRRGVEKRRGDVADHDVPAVSGRFEEQDAGPDGCRRCGIGVLDRPCVDLLRDDPCLNSTFMS
eukprot:9891475-Heterocapsa_arctica.AAC.1